MKRRGEGDTMERRGHHGEKGKPLREGETMEKGHRHHGEKGTPWREGDTMERRGNH